MWRNRWAHPTPNRPFQTHAMVNPNPRHYGFPAILGMPQPPRIPIINSMPGAVLPPPFHILTDVGGVPRMEQTWHPLDIGGRLPPYMFLQNGPLPPVFINHWGNGSPQVSGAFQQPEHFSGLSTRTTNHSEQSIAGLTVEHIHPAQVPVASEAVHDANSGQVNITTSTQNVHYGGVTGVKTEHFEQLEGAAQQPRASNALEETSNTILQHGSGRVAVYDANSEQINIPTSTANVDYRGVTRENTQHLEQSEGVAQQPRTSNAIEETSNTNLQHGSGGVNSGQVNIPTSTANVHYSAVTRENTQHLEPSEGAPQQPRNSNTIGETNNETRQPSSGGVAVQDVNPGHMSLTSLTWNVQHVGMSNHHREHANLSEHSEGPVQTPQSFNAVGERTSTLALQGTSAENVQPLNPAQHTVGSGPVPIPQSVSVISTGGTTAPEQGNVGAAAQQSVIPVTSVSSRSQSTEAERNTSGSSLHYADCPLCISAVGSYLVLACGNGLYCTTCTEKLIRERSLCPSKNCRKRIYSRRDVMKVYPHKEGGF